MSRGKRRNLHAERTSRRCAGITDPSLCYLVKHSPRILSSTSREDSACKKQSIQLHVLLWDLWLAWRIDLGLLVMVGSLLCWSLHHLAISTNAPITSSSAMAFRSDHGSLLGSAQIEGTVLFRSEWLFIGRYHWCSQDLYLPTWITICLLEWWKGGGGHSKISNSLYTGIARESSFGWSTLGTQRNY